ncbi:hypothetical protein [Nocardiopsis coralliicola]
MGAPAEIEVAWVERTGRESYEAAVRCGTPMRLGARFTRVANAARPGRPPRAGWMVDLEVGELYVFGTTVAALGAGATGIVVFDGVGGDALCSGDVLHGTNPRPSDDGSERVIPGWR